MLNLIRNTVSNFRLTKAKQDANNFLAVTGITGQVQSQAIYNLVNDLQASGLWSKMKAVYPMVTDNYNLLSYTEDFTNAYWLKTNATITLNSVTAPNGTLTADTLTDNTTSGFHYIANGPLSLGQNGNNTCSIYAKANTLNWVSLYVFDGTSGYFTYFNLSNGTVGTNPSGTTATIVDAGNGWYRCSITRNYNATAANANCGYMTANADGVNSYAGTGKSIYVWGAQFEIGASLSTYQPIATTPSAFMASQMKYNLKDARDLDAAFRLTWSGGWTYSATGATPNGTNGYINTNLVGNTNISQGNFGFGIYSRTNNSTVGAYGINGALHIYPKYTDGNTYYRIFGGGSAVTGQTTLGLIYGFNDSTSTSYGWFNGVKKQTTASSNYTIPSTNLMFAGNVTGTGGYDTRELSFGFASLYLNDSEAQLLNQIVEKYQVALSRGVQAAQSFYYNSAYSNEANTYLYSTQITGTTQVSAINTLINGLKANNLWTKMKAVYPFVTDKTLQSDMAAQMKFNLVNPQDSDAAFRLAFSGGWTYSTNGAQPNGTNGYADTKLVENTVMTSNSEHISFYSRTNASGLYADMGNNIAAETNIFPNLTNTYYARVQATNSGIAVNYNTAAMFLANRVIATEVQAWRNNVKNILLNNSTGKGTGSMFIGAMNTSTGALYFSTKQLSFATIGDGLTDTEVTLLYSLIQQYQTDLTRQV